MSINLQAVVSKIHPLYLMIPVCISCDLSFLLPVSTPPNAIVSSIVKIPTMEMIKAGTGPTIACLILLWGMWPTWGPVVFPGIEEYPSWAIGNASDPVVPYGVK